MFGISTVRVHPYYGIISTLRMSLQQTGMRPREWRVGSVSLSGYSEPCQGLLVFHTEVYCRRAAGNESLLHLFNVFIFAFRGVGI